MLAVGPIPPYVEKTPCSTSLTHWLYALFFSCSLLLYSTDRGKYFGDCMRGLNTFMSRKGTVPVS